MYFQGKSWFKVPLKILLILVAFGLTGSVVRSVGLTQQEIGLEKGLVAYWLFDGGEGDIAFDESGNYNDAGLMCVGKRCSPPRYVEGKIGYALEFDGVDDFVDCGNGESLKPSDITVTYWIRVSDASDYGGVLVGAHGDGYSSGWRTFSCLSDVIRLRMQMNFGDANPKRVDAGSWLSLNTWYHVAYTYDGQYLRSYRDGKPGQSLEDARGINWGDADPMKIGYAQWYFNGLIDEIRIYNRALTEDEIKALYEQGQQG